MVGWCCAEADVKVEVWDEEAEDGVVMFALWSPGLGMSRVELAKVHYNLFDAVIA